MTRKQCKKCPWRVDVDPHDIPNGYCETRHKNLKRTIATPGDLRALGGGTLRMMACHETGGDADSCARVLKGDYAELPCVGWMAHQLGPGNNLGLRMAVMDGRVDGDIETVGEQHESFEDTLP